MADKLTTDELSKMKVVDLKKALKERGLPLTGTKQELLDRLTTSVSAEEESDAGFDSSFFDEDHLLGNSVLDDSITIKKEVEIPKQTIPAVVPDEQTKVTERKITTQVSTETKPVTSPLSQADRIKQRAERFGVVNEDMKKQIRAERFGISSGNTKLSTAGTTADVDALKKRAERFGQVTSSTLSKVDEEERIRKRKERFGDVTSATNNSPKVAKLNISSEEEDKKKKRAERFGLS